MIDKKKESLMIITNYYPPEIGAASNRIFHLAEGLSSDYTVKVVTPLPNYPTGRIFKDYRNKFTSKSIENGIQIDRLWIFASVSKNKISRLLAMLSYSFSLILYFLRQRTPNKVIIQSPPLIVAFISIFLLKSKKRKIILNVSDLWPRAGLELGALKKNWFYSVLRQMERFNYLNSNIILGQSNEILKHVSEINPKAKTHLYRNYPIIELKEIPTIEKSNKSLTIVYAGLLGVAQGILKLCKNLDFTDIELHIYGSGAEEKEILDFMQKHPTLPIFMHGKLVRDQLHNELMNYDLAIVPLIKRIYGSVPSKIFEFSKLGLPLLYFGGGEGEKIIHNYKLGWVANVGNYENLNSIIETIKSKGLEIHQKKDIQVRANKAFSFEGQLLDLKKTI